MSLPDKVSIETGLVEAWKDTLKRFVTAENTDISELYIKVSYIYDDLCAILNKAEKHD